MKQVLENLNCDPKCTGLYLVVRLHGLVHTDDHQALLDVAAQLDLQEKLGDTVKVSWYWSRVGIIMVSCMQGQEAENNIDSATWWT